MPDRIRDRDGIVYCFENRLTGKYYVGSTFQFKRRMYRHDSEVKQGLHHSIAFQCAYNIYGPGNMEFILLEKSYCYWDSELRMKESSWIDKHKALFPFGYNMTKRTKPIYSPNCTPRVKFKIRDPQGVVHEGEGISEFCEKHNLQSSLVGQMLRGTRIHQHKGWTPVGFPEGYELAPVLPRKPKKEHPIKRKPRGPNKQKLKPKNYHRFYDPAGNLIEIVFSKKNTLRKWCEERGIEYKKFSHMVCGYTPECNGYTPHETRAKEKSRPLYVFKNPEGIEVFISNLEGYCKKNGLSATAMFEVVRGCYKSKQGAIVPKTGYRGWTFVEKLQNYFSGSCDKQITREIYDKVVSAQTPIS